MKVNSFYLRAASIACTLLLFNACGKDGDPDKPSPEHNTSAVVEAPGSRPPEPPQSEPSAPTRQEQPVVPANWIGTSAEYAATFEERLEDAEVEKIITVEVPLLENAGVVEKMCHHSSRVVPRGWRHCRLAFPNFSVSWRRQHS